MEYSKLRRDYLTRKALEDWSAAERIVVRMIEERPCDESLGLLTSMLVECREKAHQSLPLWRRLGLWFGTAREVEN